MSEKQRKGSTLKVATIALGALVLSSLTFSATYTPSKLSYVNLTGNGTEFSGPRYYGGSSNFIITNTSGSQQSIKSIQFKTSNGDIQVPSWGDFTGATSTKVLDNTGVKFIYTITFATPKVIPAGGTLTLNQIPMVQSNQSKDGTPVYNSLPDDVMVTFADGSTQAVDIKGKVTTPDPDPTHVRSAFFTNWANWRYEAPGQMYAKDMPFPEINTVNYQLASVNPDSSISFSDPDMDMMNYPAFQILRDQNSAMNLYLSVGGWGSSYKQPSAEIAAILDADKGQNLPDGPIQKLAKNLALSMYEVGFNGVDLDYEWFALAKGKDDTMATTDPNTYMVLTKDRAIGYTNLVVAVRQQLNALSAKTGERYYLSIDMPVGVDKISDFSKAGGNWETIAANCDYINAMMYDYHGQWDAPAAGQTAGQDNVTGFNGLVSNSYTYSSELNSRYNMVDSIAAMQAAGIPAGKIVMGVPVYGRLEKAGVPVTDANKGLHLKMAPASEQPLGNAKLLGGSYDYKNLIKPGKYEWTRWSGDNLLPSDLVLVPSNISDPTKPGYAEKTAWAYSKSKGFFITFDDAASAYYKGAWARQQNFAGFMIWEIDGDLPKTDADFITQSVTANLYKGFSTVNADIPAPPKPVPAGAAQTTNPTISIAGAVSNLTVGATTQLVATQNPIGTNLVFTSSSPSVASVSSSGVVTAIAAGTTTISATYQYEGKSYSSSGFVMNVTAAVNPVISISGPVSGSLPVGGKLQVTAAQSPVGSNLTFVSSNPAVATVDASGIVTAVANGTATISATYQYNGKTYSSSGYSVTVAASVVPKITISASATSVDIGGNIQVSSTQDPIGATLKYASSNIAVAKVTAAGLVTGVAAGSANITASYVYNGKTIKSSPIAITVTDKLVTPVITLTGPADNSVVIGKTLQVTSNRNPLGASFAYKSSKPTIATVNASGVVTGIAKGTATIYAQYKVNNVIYKSPVYNVNVVTAPVINPVISISGPAANSLEVGGSLQVASTQNPVGANVVFTSSNPAVASVNASGVVTALSAGDTIITASYTYDGKSYSTTQGYPVVVTQKPTQTLSQTQTIALTGGTWYINGSGTFTLTNTTDADINLADHPVSVSGVPAGVNVECWSATIGGWTSVTKNSNESFTINGVLPKGGKVTFTLNLAQNGNGDLTPSSPEVTVSF